MELRELPRRLADVCKEKTEGDRDRRRPHDPVSFQGAVPRLPDPARHRQRLRRRLGGPAEILREGRQGRVHAEADRRRPLQARLRRSRAIKLEFEAFDGYYRPVHVKHFTMLERARGGDPRGHARTRRGRHHLLRAGRTDRSGQEAIPKLTLAPVLSGSWWLEFPGFQDPKNPFHDKRVREAVSLAIDREAINQAEMRRHGRGRRQLDQRRCRVRASSGRNGSATSPKAKQLMREAGYPNGFNVDWVTPVPDYYSRGERIVSQLQAIGIQTRLQTMERGVFLKQHAGRAQGVAGGPDHPQRHADRRQLVELVRGHVQMRRLQSQGLASA